MTWILTAILCVFLVETALRLPFPSAILGISRSSARSLRVIRSVAISDHWKEKAMGAYARTTLISTLKLAGLLIALFGAAALLTVLFEQFVPGYQAFLLGWAGLTFSAVFATLYYIARQKVFGDRV